MIHILLSLPGIRNLLPLSHDQLDMLLEGNVCSETAFFRDFDLEAIPFNAETAAYAAEVEAVKPEKEGRISAAPLRSPCPEYGRIACQVRHVGSFSLRRSCSSRG